MEKCWVRVDDRLIHGQVTVGWRQHLRYQEIWVVDDEIAANPVLSDVLHLGAPAEVEVRLLDVAKAADLLSDESKVERRRCLLLVKTPQVALSLMEAGAPLVLVNVGNIAARPGSKRVFKTVSLTEEQAAALDELTAKGIEITFQQTPEERMVQWKTLRRRY